MHYLEALSFAIEHVELARQNDTDEQEEKFDAEVVAGLEWLEDALIRFLDGKLTTQEFKNLFS